VLANGGDARDVFAARAVEQRYRIAAAQTQHARGVVRGRFRQIECGRYRERDRNMEAWRGHARQG
jgi:hypothetical protein